MTTTAPRYGSSAHRTWLLACADRLTADGQHDLADEARREADALIAPAAPAVQVTQLPCESCGRPVSTDRMPPDWPFDWWSHPLAGQRCRRTA